ncbi:helix-turn-helix transcriptional regulator [Haladaptatus sp.]|uniref:helix-turn-helix transcriptional regulator n=1 Tax=Haladaptatus sp. TaxID=1973141 RepID=UPI003C3C0D7D
MDPALDEIEFLALSSNRVTVLDTLCDDSYTRRELEEQLTASQPTLGRILRDLQERGWITYDGRRYTTTATGQLVAEEFVDLLETVETELKLREVVEWLPTEAMDFDLRHLSDATITTPSQTKPGAPVQRVLELLHRSSHVQLFSYAFNEQSLGVIRQRVLDGAQTFEGVLSEDALAMITHDSALREQLRDLVESVDAEIRLYDGEIPFAVTITDDVTHLLLRDGDDFLRAALDTDDEAVLSWAREKFEGYWQRSSPVDAETLSE